MSFETIAVIGLGYIGLPTAAAFATRRKKVIGIDTNQNAVDTINRGEVHIVEPELDIVVRAAVTAGYFRATTYPEPADAFLIAVPTPFKEGLDGNIHKPDMSYIEAATQAIAPVLKTGDLVILESTSPVGTTEQLAAWLASARPDLTFPQQAGEKADVNIAHCPERVLPGHVMRELVQNSRIIGGMTNTCTRRSIELYEIFVEGECIATDVRTAEMCKLTENAFRDVNIAFANELSMICDRLKIDVWELIVLANHHPRVDILKPGPGVGGHCIAVDPWFIVDSAPEQAMLIKAARNINDSKPAWVIDKVKSASFDIIQNRPGSTISDLKIACLGLSFKADIDDLRESPALSIARQLISCSYASVLLVEPNITELPAYFTGGIGVLSSLAEAVQKADVLVVLVDHKEFKDIDERLLANKIIIDTRGIFSHSHSG